jgi:hypothetical protein
MINRKCENCGGELIDNKCLYCGAEYNHQTPDPIEPITQTKPLTPNEQFNPVQFIKDNLLFRGLSKIPWYQ